MNASDTLGKNHDQYAAYLSKMALPITPRTKTPNVAFTCCGAKSSLNMAVPALCSASGSPGKRPAAEKS